MDMNMMMNMGNMNPNMMNMGGMDPNMMNMMMGNNGMNPNMMNMGGMDLNMMNMMMMGLGGGMNNNMMGMGGMNNNMMGAGMMDSNMMMNMMMNMGMMGMNPSIDDPIGWSLIFENQTNNSLISITISEQKTVNEAIMKYRLKSKNTDKCKFIFGTKELFPEMRVCESGLQNYSKILVISIANLKGA